MPPLPPQFREETNCWHSFEEMIDSIEKKCDFFRLGSIFRRTIHSKLVIRQGLQDGYLGLRLHVEGSVLLDVLDVAGC